MGKTEMTRTTAPELDAVIVGAGFAGLYMLHLLRDKQGLKATVIDGGDAGISRCREFQGRCPADPQMAQGWL